MVFQRATLMQFLKNRLGILDYFSDHFFYRFYFVDQPHTLTTGNDSVFQISLLKGSLTHLATDHGKELFQGGSSLFHGERFFGGLILDHSRCIPDRTLDQNGIRLSCMDEPFLNARMGRALPGGDK